MTFDHHRQPVDSFLSDIAQRMRERQNMRLWGIRFEGDDLPPEDPTCQSCNGHKTLWDRKAQIHVRCMDCIKPEEVKQHRRKFSQMPPELRDLTFKTFKNWLPTGHQCKDTLRVVRNSAWAFSRGELDTEWLVLIGVPGIQPTADNPRTGTGTGKTHLAAAIVNARSEMTEGQPPALWMNAPEWIAELQSGFNGSGDGTFDERMETVQRAACLVIDDLGSEYHRPSEHGESWASVQLYRVLDTRYMRQLPTVITTNKPLLELPYRIGSRLSDTNNGMCTIHDLSRVPDYRIGIPKGPNPVTERRMNGGRW